MSVKWTEENIDKAVIAFYNREDRYPTYREFISKNNLPSTTIIKKKYGNLNSYYLLKNFIPNKIQHTKESIVEKIGLKIKILGRLPTDKELSNYSKESVYFPSVSTIRKQLGSLDSIAEKFNVQCRKNTITSMLALEILVYVTKLTNKTIYENNRTALKNGKELDIYIPDLNIGIEINGDYWHSTKYKKSDYHLDKTIEAEKVGITLCHIFEGEWNENKKIKQYLKNFILQTEIQLPKNKIVDRMKPLNYLGEIYKYTEPQLVNSGGYEVWNCGYIHYR